VLDWTNSGLNSPSTNMTIESLILNGVGVPETLRFKVAVVGVNSFCGEILKLAPLGESEGTHE
jgi:hypothetical protein